LFFVNFFYCIWQLLSWKLDYTYINCSFGKLTSSRELNLEFHLHLLSCNSMMWFGANFSSIVRECAQKWATFSLVILKAITRRVKFRREILCSIFCCRFNRFNLCRVTTGNFIEAEGKKRDFKISCTII